MIRCHENITKEKFFKKHPASFENVNLYKLTGQKNPYFFISNKEQLIGQIQFGTIEFHTWASKTKNINKPDIMVFDLDPDNNLQLKKLRQAVKIVKEKLDELNLKSFLKTSGGKGYHIVLPFKNVKNYKDFEKFAKDFSLLLENLYPNIFTTNIRKENRKGKIFIDYLRNKKGSTCVAPYSLRARDGAPISFPISWEDLDKIKPNEINIKNYTKYLNSSWKDFFNINQIIT